MGDVVSHFEKFKKGWVGGLPETPCGSGSTLGGTKEQRRWIPEIVRKYNIRSVADIGAGDLNWVKHMDWDVDYCAYDLVPRRAEVKAFNLIKEVPPKVDMIMCLWVLNHLPYENSQKAINNLKASGAKYLMMTDRPVWRQEQPPDIQMPFLEELVLNEKQDSIRLIKL